MSRVDQNAVNVVVDGVSLGIWDKLTGADTDSNDTTYQLGGMGPRISLGGSVVPTNAVLSVLYDLQKIHPLVHWLISRVGKGRVVINKQPLDVDGNVFGTALRYTGMLKRVLPPEADSESSNAALLELEVTLDQTVS